VAEYAWASSVYAHLGNLLVLFADRCYDAGMVAADVDIWRATHLLLKRYGKDAPVVAAQRAEECFASRDAEGVLTWKRIAKAMLELLKDRPGEGERIN
jgi:hypothetical protein